MRYIKYPTAGKRRRERVVIAKEDYNKIIAKKENIVATNEVVAEVPAEAPKKRGRKKKGAVVDNVAITTER